jgi:hypothetical protein
VFLNPGLHRIAQLEDVSPIIRPRQAPRERRDPKEKTHSPNSEDKVSDDREVPQERNAAGKLESKGSEMGKEGRRGHY